MPATDQDGLVLNFGGFSLPDNPTNLSNTTLDLLSGNTNVNTPPGLPGQYSLIDYRKAVAFKWKYKTDFFATLRSFKLYRRIVFQ